MNDTFQRITLLGQGSKKKQNKKKLTPDLASALAKVTEEQNWSKHPNPVSKFSVIPHQNKSREKSTQLATKTTKNRFRERELGRYGILIHASWQRAFSIFHYVKVSFGSMGVFKRANSHSKNQNRCVKMLCFGLSKDHCHCHFASESIPFILSGYIKDMTCTKHIKLLFEAQQADS